MKVSYAPYTLKGAWNREGALIRIEWEDGMGYADLHPWTELGDEPLEQQLRCFGKTALTQEAMRHSLIDAAGRRAGANLLRGLSIPQSHYLVTSEEIPEGWPAYKIKLQHLHLLERIPNGAKVRLDCNASLSLNEAETLIAKLDPERIEYIEDPCPNLWNRLKQYSIPLAADRIKGEEAEYVVVKPAVEAASSYYGCKEKIVVTSYLGHPLGQVIAAFYAGKLSRVRELSVCGLLSHTAYEANSYSRQLSQKGPTFTLPEGTGFGFDDLLKKEEWHGLRLEV